MELALYKALISINIKEELVDAVITAMDAHIDDFVGRSTAPLLAKMDALSLEMKSRLEVTNGKIDAFTLIKSDADHAKELRTQRNRWIAGYVITVSGFLITFGGLVYGWLKASGTI